IKKRSIIVKMEKSNEHHMKKGIIGQVDKEHIFKSNIYKSYIFNMLMGFHLVAGVLIPFFLTWGKISFLDLMLLQSYFTIMIFLLEIPCGAVSDRVSRRLSLFLGALSSATAVIIYSSFPNIIIFLIGETFFALGFAFISGTDEAFIYDTLRKLNREKDMTKIMAKNKSCMIAGIGISAPIGSTIALFIPIQYIMTLMFFPFITASLVSLTFREPNHNLEKESVKYLSILQSGFKKLKNNKTLRILTFDLIIIDSLVFFVLWIYQLYLGIMNIPLVFFGFIAAAMTISQVIFFNLVPKLEKFYTNKKLFLFIYTIIPGLAYIMIGVILFAPLGIILIIILIGSGLSRSIIFVNSINKMIEEENRATVLSTISMLENFIKALLYPIIGILVMWNLQYTFVILGVSILMIALLSRVENKLL
ncbi:MAG: MFS transporter, partial [Candidatus Hermodarchaeota archaeon]